MSRDAAERDAEYWRGRLNVPLPANVVAGPGARVVADDVTLRGVFSRCRSRKSPAISIGDESILDGVGFNLEENASVAIGREARLVECFLIASGHLAIGDRVTIGWHATIVDSDFHPIDPVQRSQDVLALSPANPGASRILGATRDIVIENDVWIGPLAVILKGVRVGAGARIEPGAVITHDVPPGARMLGNPARPIGATS